MNDNKIDQILEKVNDIEKVLIRHELLHERNTESLETHIKRTNLLEKQLNKIEDEINPIKTHVAIINSSVKVILTVASIIGAIILGLNSLGILQKLF